MRIALLFAFFLWTTPLAASKSELISKEDANLIASEMLTRIEALQTDLIDILIAPKNNIHPKEVAKIRNVIDEIQAPFRRALDRDLHLGATKTANQKNTSQLTMVGKCFQATSALSKFAAIIADTELRFRNPPLLSRTYLEYLSAQEDCRYQLGMEPPSHLKTPAQVYQAYLELMERTLLEMMELDDPAFLTEAKSDFGKWVVLRERLLWRLYAEQQWELYKLYAITSRSGPYSEKFRDTILSLWPCQTMHGSYGQLVDKYALHLVVGYNQLLNKRSLHRLAGKFAECKAALANQ
jgi:hypothetical protein